MRIAFDRVKQAPGAIKHFVLDRFSRSFALDPSEVKPGQGALVQAGSRKVAVYRDDEGKLHTMSPVCTHMRCIVNWNTVDKTCDCPCHGSRFNPYGHVVNGPARKSLGREDIDDEA